MQEIETGKYSFKSLSDNIQLNLRPVSSLLSKEINIWNKVAD